jgi:hypothetical protein
LIWVNRDETARAKLLRQIKARRRRHVQVGSPF